MTGGEERMAKEKENNDVWKHKREGTLTLPN